MTASQNPTYVVTGEVRGSYVRVFEPTVNRLSGRTEWSMAILIPKDDEDTLRKLRAASKAAIELKWPDASKRPRNLRNPLRDGDEERPDDPAYADHYFCNLKSSKRAPTIVDGKLQRVVDPEAFESGDYCRVSVNAYAYDQSGNRGAAFGLLNIQVIRKGEPLGAVAPNPEDEFSVHSGTADEEDMFS